LPNNRLESKFIERPNNFTSNELLDLTQKLSYFGVTSSHAKLYLYLLSKKKPVRAGIIIKETSLHRADAYRALRALRSQGLVRVEISAPAQYSAVDPAIALSTLLSQAQGKVVFLKDLKKNLGPRLKALQSISESSRPGISDPESESYYKLVSGREGYYAEVKTLIQSSQSEVLRILSALGLQLTTKLGLDKEYERVVDKGISVKIIADVRKENLKQAQKLSRVVEIRHLDEVNARFTIIDRRITIFGHKFDNSATPQQGTKEEVEGNYLVLSDPKLAEVSCFFFEHLWNISQKKF
jgi:sugar-specific transcriptional regulator TrmB